MANIDFASLQPFLMLLGFAKQIRVDHHIFTRPDIQEIINLQTKAEKPSPIRSRRVRDLMIQCRIGANAHEMPIASNKMTMNLS